MVARFPSKPARWLILALIVAPAWKLIEWASDTAAAPEAVSARAAAAGEVLFRHEWTPKDPFALGDGLGPVFNARSCVECHNQGGVGGGGPLDKNVTVYGIPANHDTHGLPPAGVVHQKAVRKEFQELLSQVDNRLPSMPTLPLAAILDGAGTQVKGVQISQRNTPALFGAGLIDAVSPDAIVAHQREHSDAASVVGLNGAHDGLVRGRVARLVDGRIGHFGWKGEFATLSDFVKAACANELGLSNPGRPQPTPLGKPKYVAKGTDLTDAQCVLMTDYIRSLPKPVESLPAAADAQSFVERGRVLFGSIGCADCHSPKLGSVAGLYSDLLLHDMGVDLESAPGAYGEPPVPAIQFDSEAPPNASEWRTPPLWGIADSAPYLHDGRAPTLEEAIGHHGGEAVDVAARYKALSLDQQSAIIAFLKTLRAPSAAAIASR
jgi:CxxC motif-containing protein (DUF1111 family)